MKKFAFILLLFILTGSIFAQDFSYTSLIRNAKSGTWFDYTDTIGANDTLRISISFSSVSPLDLQLQLNTVKISGTVTQNFIIAGSNDNVNFVDVDTIANVNVSTSTQFVNIDDWNYKFGRIRAINSATAQSSTFKLYYRILIE